MGSRYSKLIRCLAALLVAVGFTSGSEADFAITIEQGPETLELKWPVQEDHAYEVWAGTNLNEWQLFDGPSEPTSALEEYTIPIPQSFIDDNPIAFFRVKERSLGLIQDQVIEVSGVERTYDLFIPTQYSNAPVVMLFHGHGSTSDSLLGLGGEVAPYKEWLSIADEEGIILIIPDGLDTSEIDGNKGWNDCRSDAVGNSEQDDVQFIDALLDEVLEYYRADETRVYANGTSNGGHMCIRLAQEIPERLTAFAAIVSANAAFPECPDSDVPVSALFMNGTQDPFMPFTGGPMIDNRGTVLSTPATIQYWVQRNGISSPAVIESLTDSAVNDGCSVEKYTYTHNSEDTEVVLYRVIDGGHTDPSRQERYPIPLLSVLGNQSADIEMAEEVWAFFKEKTKS